MNSNFTNSDDKAFIFKEKQVLEIFKKQLYRKYPNEILNIIMYGSKARGESGPESDIDILIVMRSNDWRLGDEVRDIGYNLDGSIDYRLSIQVISESHYNYLLEHNFQFVQNISRDGISI